VASWVTNEKPACALTNPLDDAGVVRAPHQGARYDPGDWTRHSRPPPRGVPPICISLKVTGRGLRKPAWRCFFERLRAAVRRSTCTRGCRFAPKMARMRTMTRARQIDGLFPALRRGHASL
jgi:hypothetical protein